MAGLGEDPSGEERLQGVQVGQRLVRESLGGQHDSGCRLAVETPSQGGSNTSSALCSLSLQKAWFPGASGSKPSKQWLVRTVILLSPTAERLEAGVWGRRGESLSLAAQLPWLLQSFVLFGMGSSFQSLLSLCLSPPFSFPSSCKNIGH